MPMRGEQPPEKDKVLDDPKIRVSTTNQLLEPGTIEPRAWYQQTAFQIPYEDYKTKFVLCDPCPGRHLHAYGHQTRVERYGYPGTGTGTRLPG
ncbi:hypothetical protein PRIPAC_78694 [Pristionchus pacificus]|uniref:Uncharacterized protein n=1 Tax=Pristionchus pacificus TaxID=54126 RepID=A0A2A6BHR0_PRIPA|nr:hypothetical protein PRIPAC_78694 [Pristionchus pacificus]|eukprot:PDM65393.1 hypothetical protein PRIPAC_52335 [Pristionchus pacificus]